MSSLAGPLGAQDGGAAALIGEAREAIRRGDGIDAEAKLAKALKAGAPREAVAAYMGEALLTEDDRDAARAWLEAGQFDEESAFAGWRALGRLEQAEGNLPQAGRAFDKALAIDRESADLWIEIGRLRYAGGEHALAIDAAEQAVALDPRDVAALTFRGQLIRDRYGLMAALPWFETALTLDPRDGPALLEYAATLGELNRASEAVALTRRVLEIQPGEPRAYYIQAVIAARAGDYGLARALMNRTRNKLEDVPAVMLFDAVLDLAEGNAGAAAEELELFLERRPTNDRAKMLLARALYLDGQYRYLTRRLGPEVEEPGADPYVLTTVARAWEALGRRDLAAPLLDRAAAPRQAGFSVEPEQGAIGVMLAGDHPAEAERIVDGYRRALPGNYTNELLAGDVDLVLGRPREAEKHYAAAAEIRMPASLLKRRFQAFALAGDMAEAQALVESYVSQNPTDRTGLRLAALLALAEGDGTRARALLDYLATTGTGRDVQLLSDLALVEVRLGDSVAARARARAAYRLQRANPVAAQALGVALTALRQQRQQAAALLDKTRLLMGDSPLLAEARLRLADQAQG
ncbi:tetratricopeptide repeat protein [Novosphingobium sp. PC22D]|uniref:tetratricopeptide repeat protein n=1 Tax=Novosphingobium sp. PC22D TaxID=1962403 RepID=UPI001F0A9EE5|nr:tetratricopeptide repeat protein [Novosphingobium sp. PC22D]